VSGSERTPPAGDPFAGGAAGAPGEDELLRQQRAAYEAELARITVPDMLMQATVSLLNLAARRLVPEPPPASGASGQGASGEGGAGGEAPAGGAQAAGAAGGRDLEQVRDAIDGVRALLEILERRMPGELRPLRDALSQLQLAYATEIRRGDEAQAPSHGGGPGEEGPSGGGEPAPERGAQPGAEPGAQGGAGGEQRRPGPAESSGRLWVPGS
jgi:hypothetical protein